MKEIKCPNCGSIITLTDKKMNDDYEINRLLQQIKENTQILIDKYKLYDLMIWIDEEGKGKSKIRTARLKAELEL